VGSVQIIFVGISVGSLISSSEPFFEVWNGYGGNIFIVFGALLDIEI
jgi:hypothetical protein